MATTSALQPSAATEHVFVPALNNDIQTAQRMLEMEQLVLRLQRQLASAKQKSANLVDAVYAAARDAAIAVGVPAAVPAPAKDRRKKQPEVALLHLTDWQLGKRTSSYNSDVAVERVAKTVQKTIRLAEIQRADHPVRTCVVMVGGDLLENVGIFPGQAYEVDSTAFAQMFRCAQVLSGALLTLLEHFDAVEVHEVWGNHGRIGRKGEGPRGDNLDRMIGAIVRGQLAKQKRLMWHDTTSWHAIIKIGNYAALLVHGDQISGGPFAIARKANAWATGVTAPFQDMYLGHFHQCMTLTLANGGRVFMTPSTESGSEYAREVVGALGRPGQRLHFVDPDRGRVTAEYLIWLAD